MAEDRMTPDELVLAHLARASTTSCRDLAETLQLGDRRVRRRLRRLIKDGYVFSPERGRYRITAAGRRAVELDGVAMASRAVPLAGDAA